MKFEILDRLAEVPYRVRRPARAEVATWVLSTPELARIRITWPLTYKWASAAAITETLRTGLSRRGVLQLGTTPRFGPGVIVLDCLVDEQPRIVVLDFSDNSTFINDRALSNCSLYIKLEFQGIGYSDARIIPGGYPPTGLDYYRYYRGLRERFAGDRRIGVLGRFGYTFQGALRRKAVQMLSDAPDIDFVGSGKRVRYSRFLSEAASARLSLDLPGNGAFTHRVAEFLGLGSCLIAPHYSTELNVPLIAGVHYVAIANDLSDLLDVCRYYLSRDSERETIAKAGRDFFDRFLHCDQLAAYYLRNILDRLGTHRPDR